MVHASIIWMMLEKEYLQEEEEAAMLNMLIDPCPGPVHQKAGPSLTKSTAPSQAADMCLISNGNMKLISQTNQYSHACTRGEDDCPILPTRGLPSTDMDFLPKTQSQAYKSKRKQVLKSD